MALADEKAASRSVLLDRLHDDIEARLASEDPGVEGEIPMLSIGRFQEILEAAFGQPMPEPVETYAEVRTPAKVLVAAFCPRCDLPAGIMLDVRPELVVDDDGAELRLKAKAKARTHVCNQLPLEEAPAEQLSLGVLEGVAPETHTFPEGALVPTLPSGPYAVCDVETATLPVCREPVNLPDLPDSAVCGAPHGHAGDHVADGLREESTIILRCGLVQGHDAEEPPAAADPAFLVEHVDFEAPMVGFRWPAPAAEGETDVLEESAGDAPTDDEAPES